MVRTPRGGKKPRIREIRAGRLGVGLDAVVIADLGLGVSRVIYVGRFVDLTGGCQVEGLIYEGDVCLAGLSFELCVRWECWIRRF